MGVGNRTPRDLLDGYKFTSDFSCYGSSSEYKSFLTARETNAESSRLNNVQSNFTTNLVQNQPKDEDGQIQENHNQIKYEAKENHKPLEKLNSENQIQEAGQIQENHDQIECVANNNNEPIDCVDTESNDQVGASGSSLIDNNGNIIYD